MELKLKNWSTQISPFLSATSNKHQATRTELERARVCVSNQKEKEKNNNFKNETISRVGFV